MDKIDIMHKSGYINAIVETFNTLNNILENKIVIGIKEFISHCDNACAEYNKQFNIFSSMTTTTAKELPRAKSQYQKFLKIANDLKLYSERLKNPDITTVCNSASLLASSVSEVCNFEGFSSPTLRHFFNNSIYKITDSDIDIINKKYDNVQAAENRILNATMDAIFEAAQKSIDPKSIAPPQNGNQNGSLNQNSGEASNIEKLNKLKDKVSAANTKFKLLYEKKGFAGIVKDPQFLKSSLIVSGGILSLYAGYKFGVMGLKKIRSWWRKLWGNDEEV